MGPQRGAGISDKVRKVLFAEYKLPCLSVFSQKFHPYESPTISSSASPPLLRPIRTHFKKLILAKTPVPSRISVLEVGALWVILRPRGHGKRNHTFPKGKNFGCVPGATYALQVAINEQLNEAWAGQETFSHCAKLTKAISWEFFSGRSNGGLTSK